MFSRLGTVRRFSPFALALTVAAALAVALSACGSSGGADLLPGTTADQITSNLDEVQRLVAEGDCVGATNAADEVSAEVEEIGGIDAKLKALLSEGAERLHAVVDTCEEGEATESTEDEGSEFEEDEKAAKHEKAEKSKPPKEKEPPVEPPEPPGQDEEEGKGKGPPEEGGSSPSGGVGPGQEVEGN